MLELRARKIAVPVVRRRKVIETIRQGLPADGITVSIARLCPWFGVPRRTVSYRPVGSAPKIDPRFAAPVKALMEESPSFGYRTVAHLQGLNKNTAQRAFPFMAGRFASGMSTFVIAVLTAFLGHENRALRETLHKCCVSSLAWIGLAEIIAS